MKNITFNKDAQFPQICSSHFLSTSKFKIYFLKKNLYLRYLKINFIQWGYGFGIWVQSLINPEKYLIKKNNKKLFNN